jgi:glutathione synthase/RimK-type ligase-like ATP-grasp enzyme
VLKQPDSAFSQGVVRVSDPEQLKIHLDRLLAESDLVVAQEYVESDFDWRIGVLGGHPIYACRYYMARGHWQIQKSEENGKKILGRHETLSVAEAPGAVIDLAVRVAGLIGKGLYGVDIKETQGRLMVVEINDNPNIEAGVEDMVERENLYLVIMRHFYERLEQKGRAQ